MTVCVDREWRPVEGFPYEVSDDGLVRRTAPGHNTYPGRVLKGYVDRDGYTVVRLCRDGIAHDRKIHRLVCEAFHGSSHMPEVRHLDGDPSNNRADNLAWGTTTQNAQDRNRHDRTQRGERSPRAKLTNAQVSDIRAAHVAAKTGRRRVPRGWATDIAGRYGMSVHGIATIVAGRGYPEA